MESRDDLIKKSVEGLKALAALAERTSRALEDYDIDALLKMIPPQQKSLFEDEQKTPAQPTYKQLQSLIAEKERKGFRNEVHTILFRHGAKNLSDLRPDMYVRFKRDVEEYCRDISKGEVLQAAHRILANRMSDDLKELLLFNGATSIDNLPKSRYASFLFEARRM